MAREPFKSVLPKQTYTLLIFTTECKYCSAKWCRSCRTGLRVLHAISCPSYEAYGGLEEQEALSRSGFRDRKPCPPAPLRGSEIDVQIGIAIVAVVIVIAVLLTGDWTSVFLFPVRLIVWLPGVSLNLIFGTSVCLFRAARFLIGISWAFVYTILTLLIWVGWFFVRAAITTLQVLFGVSLILVGMFCNSTAQGLLLMVFGLWWTLCVFVKLVLCSIGLCMDVGIAAIQLALSGVSICVGIVLVTIQLAWGIAVGIICLPFSLLAFVFS